MAGLPQFQVSGGRRVDRFAFSAEVQFRSGTRRAVVQVRDISTLGARVSGVFRVHVDEHIYLKLPMIEPIPARIAWINSFEFGCEFDRPLGEPVLAAITAQQR
ncbi:MAG: PilZ domain-containing protein [Novosphingobium sp.]